jgi:hypothetical protein
MNITRGIKVANEDSHDLVIWIEPWADDFTIAPKDELCIEFDGPEDGEIVVVHSRQGIQLYGFNGSMAYVKKGGKVIWQAHQRLPVKIPPDDFLPGGTNNRSQ